jgi:hypothetical protein
MLAPAACHAVPSLRRILLFEVRSHPVAAFPPPSPLDEPPLDEPPLEPPLDEPPLELPLEPPLEEEELEFESSLEHAVSAPKRSAATATTDADRVERRIMPPLFYNTCTSAGPEE